MLHHRYAVGAVITVAALGTFWGAGRAWSLRRLPVAPPIVVDFAYTERTDTLHLDEPLSALLGRQGITGNEMYDVLGAAPSLNPRRIRAGRVFEFRYAVGESTPTGIAIRLDADQRLQLRRGDDGWTGEMEQIEWRARTMRFEGVIEGSLYESIHRVIPDSVLDAPQRDRLIADLADGVFGWDIDFSREVYPGDRFRLLYDRLASSLGDVRYGRLVSAKLETRGVENTAYVIVDDQGRNTYFDARGVSLRRAFKRNPVAYLRISSSFSGRRFHPVLGRWRAHYGVDYAAGTGTPIYATGDGVVKFAGRDGGYGLMVKVRHAKGIETRYAHMSRIRRGIRSGVRVAQGQVVGYVGMTGLANGPHVHYEFLKNGRFLNPRSVDFGEGEPLPDARHEEFDSLRRHYDLLLDGPATYELVLGGN